MWCSTLLRFSPSRTKHPTESLICLNDNGYVDTQDQQGLSSMLEVNSLPLSFKICFGNVHKARTDHSEKSRANAIVERMHAVLGNMIRCQLVSRSQNDDPLYDMTSAAAFAIRSTVHGTTKYSPGQLIFRRDMIQCLVVEANVELVRQRREAAIRVNNARENQRRVAHEYQPGDKVLILSNSMDPKLQLNQSPYKVTSYDKSNGILYIQRKHDVEPINIRNVRPCFGRYKAKA